MALGRTRLGYFVVDVQYGWAANVVVVVERTARLVEWEWGPTRRPGWETEEGRKQDGLEVVEACGLVNEGSRMMCRQGGS